MPTSNQLTRKPRKNRKRKKRGTSLGGNPEQAGIVLRSFIIKPKKPNSAERKCARVRLSNGKEVTCHIPGEGHNIQEHSNVLVRGGRVKDLPGVRHKIIRNNRDLQPVKDRKQGRSRFGTAKS